MNKQYGEFKELQHQLLHKKIVSWDENKLVLDDGTVITIEMSESDCCAYAGGEFKNVELDAVITDIKIYDKGTEESWDNTTNYAEVVIFHNQNKIAQADCSADDGNGGYYYSVCALRVKGVYYEITRA